MKKKVVIYGLSGLVTLLLGLFGAKKLKRRKERKMRKQQEELLKQLKAFNEVCEKENVSKQEVADMLDQINKEYGIQMTIKESDVDPRTYDVDIAIEED